MHSSHMPRPASFHTSQHVVSILSQPDEALPKLAELD
jgi:hypothetical protein